MPEHKRWGNNQERALFIKGGVRTGHLALFGLYTKNKQVIRIASAVSAQVSNTISNDHTNYEKRRVHLRCVIRIKECV